jgi:GYF domain 2
MRIHIARHGTRLGDYDIEDAKTRFRLGSLKANDLAWYEGASDWIGQIFREATFSARSLPWLCNGRIYQKEARAARHDGRNNRN